MSTIEELLATDPSLLLVDDDAAFLQRLERAMSRRGFDVRIAGSVAEGLAAGLQTTPLILPLIEQEPMIRSFTLI